MSMRFVLLCACLATVGCAGSVVVDASADHWGAPLTAASAEPLALAALLDGAATYDGRTVAVRGKVVEVCQTKGCWMLLSDGKRELRVRFLDYAFFVPKGLAGEVVVEGVFAIQMVPVDEARHYLEDAGKHEQAMAITVPQKSFTFMANGVRRA